MKNRKADSGHHIAEETNTIFRGIENKLEENYGNEHIDTDPDREAVSASG